MLDKNSTVKLRSRKTLYNRNTNENKYMLLMEPFFVERVRLCTGPSVTAGKMKKNFERMKAQCPFISFVTIIRMHSLIATQKERK